MRPFIWELSHQGILNALFVTWAWLHQHATMAEVGPDTPCGVLQETSGGGGTPDSDVLYNKIVDLRMQSYGNQLVAEEVMFFITDKFPSLFTEERLSDLNGLNFIEPISQSSTNESAINATLDNEAALQAHWTLLYKLVIHLDHVHQHGEFLNSTGDESAVDNIRFLLVDLQSKIYSMICNLKIGLNALNSSTSTPEYGPPDVFLGHGATLIREIERAYVVTRETEMVMHHTNFVYKKMENAME